jgi:hypothetical protein
MSNYITVDILSWIFSEFYNADKKFKIISIFEDLYQIPDELHFKKEYVSLIYDDDKLAEEASNIARNNDSNRFAHFQSQGALLKIKGGRNKVYLNWPLYRKECSFRPAPGFNINYSDVYPVPAEIYFNGRDAMFIYSNKKKAFKALKVYNKHVNNDNSRKVQVDVVQNNGKNYTVYIDGLVSIK